MRILDSTTATGTSSRPTVAVVDLDAIRHNVRTLRPPGAEVMAVVKANGYGHGDVAVAGAALDAGASWLGVALVEEGIRLRHAGLDAPILVLTEFPPGSETEALAAGLTPSLYSEMGLRGVAEAARRLGPGTPRRDRRSRRPPPPWRCVRGGWGRRSPPPPRSPSEAPALPPAEQLAHG